MDYKYILSCESACDLSKEKLEEFSLNYLSFHYYLDETEYTDDYNITNRLDEFYKKLKEGAKPRTAQIAVSEYMAYFEKFLEQGLDILHITLSSGISGTYNAALKAKDELKNKYPNNKIYIVDSLCASSGFGLYVIKAAKLRNQGLSIDELFDWCEENKQTINHWFYSYDLTYYYAGGRVSKTSFILGTLLKICPVLEVNSTGHLVVNQKARTKRRAQSVQVKKMAALVKDGFNYNEECFISHSNCLDDAIELKNELENIFPNLKNKIEIYNIGPTIASHSGPGTVALFFCGNERQ